MQSALKDPSTSSQSFSHRIKMISAREKYDKIGFLRMLMEFYSQNKDLANDICDIARGYKDMADINIMYSCGELDSLDEYEAYISNLDEETVKAIYDDYKNERS